MRIVSLHVDGLEQAVVKGLYSWLKDIDADVVAIQNLKAKEYQLYDAVVYPDGFNAYFFDAEADDYSGDGKPSSSRCAFHFGGTEGAP